MPLVASFLSIPRADAKPLDVDPHRAPDPLLVPAGVPRAGGRRVEGEDRDPAVSGEASGAHAAEPRVDGVLQRDPAVQGARAHDQQGGQRVHRDHHGAQRA
eukprot:2255565-Rhodomonas_salina.2